MKNIKYLRSETGGETLLENLEIIVENQNEIFNKLSQLSNKSEVMASGKVHSEDNMGHLTIYMDTKDNGLQEVWRIIEDKLINYIDKPVEISVRVINDECL